MPWARLDDRYDDSPKVRAVFRRSPTAVAVHVFAISYCNRHMTDGLVPRRAVDLWLYDSPLGGKVKQEALNALLDGPRPLLEQADDEHYRVRDFLDWNLSRADREVAAEVSRENGRKGGRPRSPLNPPGNPPANPAENPPGFADGNLDKTLTTPLQGEPTENVNTNAELRSAVTECFAYWQERCQHPQSQLDGKRRRSIEGRLRDRQRHHSGDLRAAVRDVRAAIDGAAVGAYVNDRGKRFDDIELICRNVAKLEDFIGRAKLPDAPRASVTPIRPSAADLIRKLNESEARA